MSLLVDVSHSFCAGVNLELLCIFLVILNGTEEFLRFRSLFAPRLQFVKPG